MPSWYAASGTHRAARRLLDELAQELRPLALKLPGTLKADFDPTDPDVLRELLAEVERTLPTRLLEEPA